MEQDGSASSADNPKMTVKMLEANLTEDETRILNTIRARQMLRSEDTMDIENFAADIIDGRRINLEHGSLGLAEATGAEEKKEKIDVMALLVGENKMGKMDEGPAAITTVERTAVSAY